MAASSSRSAASRYLARLTWEMSSASALLSKPWAEPSAGRSLWQRPRRAGRTGRGRVFSYSARVSRRRRGAALRRHAGPCRRRRALVEALGDGGRLGGGRPGLLLRRHLAGRDPVVDLHPAGEHCRACGKSAVRAVRSRPPFFVSASWHSAQCFWTNARRPASSADRAPGQQDREQASSAAVHRRESSGVFGAETRDVRRERDVVSGRAREAAPLRRLRVAAHRIRCLHAISSPRIVPLPVENSPASMPRRWSIETYRLVSG